MFWGAINFCVRVADDEGKSTYGFSSRVWVLLWMQTFERIQLIFDNHAE